MIRTDLLLCPVCHRPLHQESKALRCDRGHSFDIAKEGYVNLLRSSRDGDRMGDDRYAARSRRAFLDKGYYAPLQDSLCDLIRDQEGTVLDICCGEGYYTAALGAEDGLCVYGFDLSKEMVRLAAKRGGATYFVANMTSIPVPDSAFDTAFLLFAPFHEPEIFRVLQPGGCLYTVVPGRRHLYGLKEVLYDEPYENDEALPPAERLRLTGTTKLSRSIVLASQEDIDAVFQMTPYYHHTSARDRAKLQGLDRLETQIEFVIARYEKPL